MMRYEAPSGGHDDMVMSLAIGWSGIAGRKHKALNPEFMRQIMEVNGDLCGGDGGDMERLPSDYPEGGSQGSRRWSN